MASVLAPYATSIGMGTPPYGRPLQQVEGRPTLPWRTLMVGHNGPQSAQVKRTRTLGWCTGGGGGGGNATHTTMNPDAPPQAPILPAYPITPVADSKHGGLGLPPNSQTI